MIHISEELKHNSCRIKVYITLFVENLRTNVTVISRYLYTAEILSLFHEFFSLICFDCYSELGVNLTRCNCGIGRLAEAGNPGETDKQTGTPVEG